MRTRILILLCTLLLARTVPGIACSCGGLPIDAIQMLRQISAANWEAGKSPQERILVATGVYTGRTANGQGVRFALINQCYGRRTRDTITIWGTDRADCREDVQNQYRYADTAIYILSRIHVNQGDENTTDYFADVCMNAYLPVRNDSVFGGLHGSFTAKGFPLRQFTDTLCLESRKLDVAPNEGLIKLLQAIPNIAKSGATITVISGGPEPSTLSIFNSAGIKIDLPFRSASGSAGNKYLLSTGNVPPGSYFIRATTSSGWQTVPITIL